MTTLRQLAVKMVAELLDKNLLLQDDRACVVATDTIERQLNGWIKEMRDRLRTK